MPALFIKFVGQHGRLPTTSNCDYVTAPLEGLKCTASPVKGGRLECHIKVAGDAFTYQVTEETYNAVNAILENSQQVKVFRCNEAVTVG